MDLLVRALRRHALAVVDDFASVARAVAFWAGIALPCLHVPLLLIVGLTERTTPVLLGLWALHAIVLVAGSRHTPRRNARRETAETTASESARSGDV